MLEEAVDTQDSHAVVYQDESFVEFENYSARWEKISVISVYGVDKH